MKKNPAPESGLFTLRILLSVTLCLTGVMFAMFSFAGDSSKQQTNASAVGNPAVEAQETLAQIERARGGQMITQVSRSTGRFAFVRAADRNILVPSSDASATPEARALAFLADYGALVGLNEAERDSLRSGATPAAASKLRSWRRTPTNSACLTCGSTRITTA